MNLLTAAGQITSLSSEISEVNIKSLLGDYMQNRGDRDSENDSALIQKRILVGLMLVKLAEEIESALR